MGFQDTIENIRRYAAEQKIPYPVAYDEGNKLASSYGLPYGAGVIFISKDGIVTGRFRSGFSEADFEKELKKIL
jgi:hypothetical protein